MDQTQPTLIPINKLECSPLNVRRTSRKDGDAELKASILAHGLMQNLVVTENVDGNFHVIAGGRRLEALRALRDEGRLPDGYAVPCQVVAEEFASEMSLAENVVRVAMHPADEFEAFAALVESGLTTGEVAARFGATEKHVLQRLRLARVAPEIVAEYRTASIDLECLMAFTVTDDRARQLDVFRSLRGWQMGNARHIKERLTEATVRGDDKRARFVGLDAYAAAGGAVRTDLFGEESYLEDPELLNLLAGEKLGEAKARLEAEGWGWVEVADDRDYSFLGKHGRLRATPTEVPAELVAERGRLRAELEAMRDADEPDEGFDDDFYERQERLEEQLQAAEDRVREFVAFDPRKMRTAGCYLCIGHDGRLVIERGLVRKKDEKEIAKAKKGKVAPSAAPAEPLSEALRQDLKAFRLQVAQVEIASDPDIAFDLLVFSVASGVLGFRSPLDGPDVHLGGRLPAIPRHEGTAAERRFEAIGQGLPRAWLEPESEAERFELFRTLDQDDKRRLLAYCAAKALRPRLAPTSADDVTAFDLALMETGGRVEGYWRPTKSNYLGRVTRDQLLAIGEAVFGAGWAKDRRNDKKGKLADILDAAFASPEEEGKTSEQAEKLKNWLPAGMSFSFGAKPRSVIAPGAKKGEKAA